MIALSMHAQAVDVRPVAAAEVAEDPVAVGAGDEFGVSPADRVVGEGELAAVAPDQRRRIGQLEASALVRTL
jgi:hypothetical protein